MPSEKHEDKIKELLGQTFNEKEVPSYPARIFWYDGGFMTSIPHAPVRMGEVRFRETYATEEGDFVIYQARTIDTSNPEDSHSEWFHEADQ